MNVNQYAIIMAGGVGTRLWPFSRTNFPKQFHDLLDTGKSMLQETIERFENICPFENIFIVANEIYKEIIEQQFPNLPKDNILLEPIKRNTAPCIAYATYKIFQKNPNANLVIAPADQHIKNRKLFADTIQKALDFTEKNDALVTLGIKPTRPDTGYGYIQFKEHKTKQVKKVIIFTEKPDVETAKGFLKSGDFVWNAGIFIWKAKDIIKAFEEYLPQLSNYFEEMKDVFYTPKEQSTLRNVYAQMRLNISIDKGIMESAENVHVILSEFDWSDVGTWKSLYEESKKDEQGNVITGNVRKHDTKNCIIKMPDDKLVVVQGLDNLIVAEFDGVLLICRKDEEQRVKDFVEDAKLENNKYV